MKNRKIVVVAIMLTAVLCLGVGYAALNNSITATGTVNVNATGFDLQWESDDSSAISTTANDDSLTFTIAATEWTKEGDSVTIKAKVKNASTQSFNAKITAVTVTNESDFYSVVCSGIDVNDIIEEGESVSVTITVTLDQMPTENITSDTFTVTVDAEAVVPTT